MPIVKDGETLFTHIDLKPLVENEGIIDATKGGLILGISHKEGGIKVFAQYKNESLYEIIAEFEGWEYILNPTATANNLEYLNKINEEFVNTKIDFIEYDIPNNIATLDVRPVIPHLKSTSKFLLIGQYDQFIVNKHATKKYLNELNALNKEHMNLNL